MKTIKFFLKLIFGTLAILIIFNFYILPILKNYGGYLYMSYLQDYAEKMINRGYTSRHCDDLVQKIPKNSHHYCLKNAKLARMQYHPTVRGSYSVNVLYVGEYKNNIACEFELYYREEHPNDPDDCYFVSYDKLKNKSVPFGDAYKYFVTKNRNENNNK